MPGHGNNQPPSPPHQPPIPPQQGATTKNEKMFHVYMGPVRIYEHANYEGRSQVLELGSYSKSVLTIGYDRASSVQVTGGYKATLFDGGNFTGETKVLTGFCANLGSFNDRMASIRVERSETAPLTGVHPMKVTFTKFVAHDDKEEGAGEFFLDLDVDRKAAWGRYKVGDISSPAERIINQRSHVVTKKPGDVLEVYVRVREDDGTIGLDLEHVGEALETFGEDSQWGVGSHEVRLHNGEGYVSVYYTIAHANDDHGAVSGVG